MVWLCYPPHAVVSRVLLMLEGSEFPSPLVFISMASSFPHLSLWIFSFAVYFKMDVLGKEEHKGKPGREAKKPSNEAVVFLNR